MNASFANPWALLLLLIVPAGWWWLRRQPGSALTFSRAGLLGRVAGASAQRLAKLPAWLRGGAIIALILALAGPRTGQSIVDVSAEGIAIMLVLDISSSMLAEDFAPDNRLAVAKQKVAEFVRGRQYDRIGLVAFAGEALTQVPITIDYPVIYQAIDQLQAGTQQLEDGTAIGTAIAVAANRLRDVPGSRVMILLTDGENNRGEIDPVTAAQAAAAYDIKIHTIGVGSEGMAPIPIAAGPFGLQYATLPVHIDEELLTEVASLTGGRYFRATSEVALDSIYHQIDRLEKTTVDVKRYMQYTPHYLPFLLIGVIALMSELLLRASRWGRAP